MKNHFVKGAKNASKSITLLICVARRLNCSAGFAFLGLRFLPQLPGPNRAFSFSSGRRVIQPMHPSGL